MDAQVGPVTAQWRMGFKEVLLRGESPIKKIRLIKQNTLEEKYFKYSQTNPERASVKIIKGEASCPSRTEKNNS